MNALHVPVSTDALEFENILKECIKVIEVSSGSSVGFLTTIDKFEGIFEKEIPLQY